jgi:hypothetical protein
MKVSYLSFFFINYLFFSVMWNQNDGIGRT